jgi:hypothetical protein
VQITSKGMFPSLSTLVLCTNILVISARNRKKRRVGCVQPKRVFRSRAPDCPVVPRPPDSVRCARLPRAKRPLSGIRRRRMAKIHRTVRCAPDCPVSQRSACQRSAAESARDTWSGQRSEGGTGLSGVHRTCPVCTGHVRCARSATVGNGRLRRLRK